MPLFFLRIFPSPFNTFYMDMKKIRLHPFFIILGIFLLLRGKLLIFLHTLVCVFIHEYAHSVSAKKRGYRINSLTLMPYGAVLNADSGLSDEDAFAVYASGPMINFLAALSVVALWWTFPESYSFTLGFFKVNLALGIFNLLPLYPLDGSRILLSAVKNKKRCLRILIAAGYGASFLCAVLFVVSAFFELVYSFALVSVMLFLGASVEAEKEKYVLFCKEFFCVQDLSRPLKKTELYVHSSASVGSLTRNLTSEGVYVVRIVDGNMNILKTLEGRELEKLFFMEKSRPMAALLAEKSL